MFTSRVTDVTNAPLPHVLMVVLMFPIIVAITSSLSYQLSTNPVDLIAEEVTVDVLEAMQIILEL